MRRSIRVLAVALASGAVFVAGGCGSSAPAPVNSPASASDTAAASASAPALQSLIAQIRVAITSASSVHEVGLIKMGSQAQGEDLSLTRAGGVSGTLTATGRPPVTMIATGQADYVLLTPAFLQSLAGPPVTCPGRCGKYLMVSANLMKEVLSGTLSLGSEMQLPLDGLHGLSRAGTATVNGQPVQVLHGPDHEVLDVAATGNPYPVRISADAGAHATAAYTYTQWNSVPPVSPPPAADIAHLASS